MTVRVCADATDFQGGEVQNAHLWRARYGREGRSLESDMAFLLRMLTVMWVFLSGLLGAVIWLALR